MEKAWCAFANAEAMEEGRQDFNAAMSEIARAKEDPSTSIEKAPNTREEATRAWNRQQQQPARKHHGTTEARQEYEARAHRGEAVTDRRRCDSNTLDNLPNSREEEAHRPSEDTTKPREKEPEPREEPPTLREKTCNPREEAIRIWNQFLTTQQQLARKHQGRGPGPPGGSETLAPMHIREEPNPEADKTKEAWRTFKATRGAGIA